MATHNVTGSFSGTGIITIPDFESDVIITRGQVWWNSSYTYRRKLLIQSNPEGFELNHPLYALLSKDLLKQRKVRSDYKDIQVLRLVTEVPEVWQVIRRDIETLPDDIKVTWPSETNIDPETSIEDLYYIYYGNSTLVNIPHEIVTIEYSDPEVGYDDLMIFYADDNIVNFTDLYPYDPEEWPVSYAYNSGEIAYTRPGEHWEEIDGVFLGMEDGAKATLEFYGSSVRIIADKHPAYGIAEVQIDDEEWTQVDLYNYQHLADQQVYVRTDLSEQRHIIRYRRTGFKASAASDYFISLSRIEYLRHNKVLNIKEETDESIMWGSALGGVVSNG